MLESTLFEHIDNEDKNKILYQFNNTYHEYPQNSSIIELFNNSIKCYPDNIAVIDSSKKLTYLELNCYVSVIAKSLSDIGCMLGDVIAIYLNRHAELIASILAINKIGCTYVVIDKSYPEQRVNYILSNSGAKAVILESAFINENLIEFNKHIDIRLLNFTQSNNKELSGYDQHPKNSKIAALIYTSGSSGQPKGVMITPSNIINFSFWYISARALQPSDNIAGHASFSFDASIMVVYPTLFCGATLHILNESIRLSLIDLDAYFISNKINGCFFSTKFGEQFVEYTKCSSLRFIEVGGEKLNRFQSKPFALINGYGPTETTVYATNFLVTHENNNIPIGKPISNTQVYVLNEFLQLCKIGQIGELYIAGHGTSDGYWNNLELTNEKFINNPYQQFGDERINKAILYKTGDLACWKSDGNIEFMGRVDEQVKIRGHRIELGEIESALNSHPEILQAAVKVHDTGSDNKYLVGYYVSMQDFHNNIITNYLKDILPDYMLPNILVKLKSIPFNTNGKVDKHLLPSPDLFSNRLYVAPRNNYELELTEIWADLLKLKAKAISIFDDFFELGGNSIIAIKMVNKIRVKFGVTTDFITITENRTVDKICTAIFSADSDAVLDNYNEEWSF